MPRAAAFLGSAALGYVLMRAGWIFLTWPGVVAVLVLVAVAAWWRRPVGAGLAVGAALSALALTL